MSDTKYRNPDRGYREFGRWEIVPNGPWVPNIDDKIIDWDQGFFRVVDVDITTGESTLIPWEPPVLSNLNNEDLLVGIGPGYSSESYRIFLDQAVTPFQFTPDFRLHSYGSQAQYYKVFLGSDISDTYGKVISAMYDTSYNFLGDTIPLEVVDVSDPNSTIKAPAPGYTSEKLSDGELVTLVFYAADGTALSKAQLLVVNSKAIRRSDASKRYVESIYLDSPFLSTADPMVIEFPLNVTVESLPLTAVVQYSDGTKSKQSINGLQFKLLGLNNYIATEVGQQFPLSLNYTLAANEVSFNMVPSVNKTLNVAYTARTVTADGAYEVKIFAYPVWMNPQLGFRMEYWLYNLDRHTFYNVTPYIELAANSAAFDPLYYGAVQTFTVAVDLNKVDGSFAQYRAVQIIRLALLSSGDNQPANWEILFTPNQQNGYGNSLTAQMHYVSTNNWKVNLKHNFQNKDMWLKHMFYDAEPLYNIELEEAAPKPTHFILQFLHNAYEFSVDQWNQDLTVNNDLTHGKCVWIRWIHRTINADLQLATTALPVTIA